MPTMTKRMMSLACFWASVSREMGAQRRSSGGSNKVTRCNGGPLSSKGDAVPLPDGRRNCVKGCAGQKQCSVEVTALVTALEWKSGRFNKINPGQYGRRGARAPAYRGPR